ncbi:hypothetical protein [Streptococcus pneumoniae]|uniref:hypothetical protein n=1 Tax=Streptococcus pneumoniae TaxID=1313 RepID=UPI001EDDD468|nr:hypothetical protein [Streptococcus pneumoniae]
MKKSTVLSLTTAAVILAAYAPNEVVLADTSSSEDALTPIIHPKSKNHPESLP